MATVLPGKLKKSILIKCFNYYRKSFKKFNVSDEIIQEIESFINLNLPDCISSSKIEKYMQKLIKSVISKHYNFMYCYLIKSMIMKKLPRIYNRISKSTKL